MTQEQITYEKAHSFILNEQAEKKRKGDNTYYFGHLLRVTGLVFEMGGGYREATVAILHDALEDIDNSETFIKSLQDDIYQDVLGCSDCITRPKKPWLERKCEHLLRIKTNSATSNLVLLADKIDNIFNYIKHIHDREFIHKFNCTEADLLWYFKNMQMQLSASNVKYEYPLCNKYLGRLKDAVNTLEYYHKLFEIKI